MRPVSATRKPYRESARVAVNRRTGARALADRPASGKRNTLRNDSISRLARILKSALSPRRPVTLLSVSVMVAAAFAALWTGGYIHRAVAGTNRTIGALLADAGFSISAIHLSGNHYTSPGVILSALAFSPGQPIFGADLHEARARLLKLDWVADAQVFRRYPDSVSVRVVEKTPFGLWSSPDGLFVIDRLDNPIARARQKEFSKLPWFVGDRPEGASELVEPSLESDSRRRRSGQTSRARLAKAAGCT